MSATEKELIRLLTVHMEREELLEKLTRDLGRFIIGLVDVLPDEARNLPHVIEGRKQIEDLVKSLS